jgi:hypothetical protein
MACRIAPLVAAITIGLLASPGLADGYALEWDTRPGGCRAAGGGQGEFSHFSGLTLQQCKAKCYGRRQPVCDAVEYNRHTRGCEVHRRTIVGSSGNTQSGTACHKVINVIWG